MYIKINKKQARILYGQNKPFIIVPCKCGVLSMLALTVNSTTFERLIGYNFDQLVNSFTYYNCNHETGYYPAYYIKS